MLRSSGCRRQLSGTCDRTIENCMEHIGNVWMSKLAQGNPREPMGNHMTVYMPTHWLLALIDWIDSAWVPRSALLLVSLSTLIEWIWPGEMRCWGAGLVSQDQVSRVLLRAAKREEPACLCAWSKQL